jgi:nucleoid DNA-binding protein
MAGQLGKSIKDITIRIRDYKVPYQMKKFSIRPILMGLADTILEVGEVNVSGFGRFYVHRKRVSPKIGSRDKIMRYHVAFKPYKSFLKRVEERWNQPVVVSLSEESPKSSSQESVESVAGTESLV